MSGILVGLTVSRCCLFCGVTQTICVWSETIALWPCSRAHRRTWSAPVRLVLSRTGALPEEWSLFVGLGRRPFKLRGYSSHVRRVSVSVRAVGHVVWSSGGFLLHSAASEWRNYLLSLSDEDLKPLAYPVRELRVPSSGQTLHTHASVSGSFVLPVESTCSQLHSSVGLWICVCVMMVRQRVRLTDNTVANSGALQITHTVAHERGRTPFAPAATLAVSGQCLPGALTRRTAQSVPQTALPQIGGVLPSAAHHHHQQRRRQWCHYSSGGAATVCCWGGDCSEHAVTVHQPQLTEEPRFVLGCPGWYFLYYG